MKSDQHSQILLVKGIAGLGNRILSLLTGILYADLTGRAAQVDWTDAVFAPNGDTDTKHVNLFPLLFESATVTACENACDLGRSAGSNVAPSVWKDHLHLSAADLTRQLDPTGWQDFDAFKKSSISIAQADVEHDLVIYWSFRDRILPLRRLIRHRQPRWSRLTDTAILQNVYQQHLRPTAEVQGAVDRVFANHDPQLSIGLHIRQSDLKAPVDRLITIADRLMAVDRDRVLFLSTDNQDVQRRVVELFGESRVRVSTKAFAAAGMPLHYDSNCRNRIARASEALIDMMMLSRCPHLVYASRSSFGMVAHILSSGEQTLYDCDRFDPKVQVKRLVQKYRYR